MWHFQRPFAYLCHIEVCCEIWTVLNLSVVYWPGKFCSGCWMCLEWRACTCALEIVISCWQRSIPTKTQHLWLCRILDILQLFFFLLWQEIETIFYLGDDQVLRFFWTLSHSLLKLFSLTYLDWKRVLNWMWFVSLWRCIFEFSWTSRSLISNFIHTDCLSSTIQIQKINKNKN